LNAGNNQGSIHDFGFARFSRSYSLYRPKGNPAVQTRGGKNHGGFFQNVFGEAKKCTIIITILLLVSLGICQEYISGEITRNTSWRGDIYINGDVTVPQGVILTIEEGSKVHFKPNSDVQKGGKDKDRSEIIVNGILRAKSSSSARPIVFTSAARSQQMNDWYGITIKNFFDQSVLENCIVEFGYKGLTCYGSSPLIKGGEFRFNHNSGISCEVKSNPLIQNVLIFGNGFAGINCELASRPVISGCTISENNYGIVIFSRSAPDLGTTPVTDDQSRGENRLSNNFDFDVYNHSTETISARNNIWISSNAREIQTVIYDELDNQAYGEVVFKPVFVEKKPTIPYATLVASLAKKDTQFTRRDTSRFFAFRQDSTGTDSVSRLRAGIPASAGSSLVSNTPSSPALLITLTPDSLYASRGEKGVEPVVKEEPLITGPVLEAFLDGGKRQYAKRVAPEYPEIYRKTGTEGDVLFEVVVNEAGRIDEYRVLKSDGDLFSQAAESALKQFRYRPGKMEGKSVKFKVIERFRFKLN
jgi:TonB family protein